MWPNGMTDPDWVAMRPFITQRILPITPLDWIIYPRLISGQPRVVCLVQCPPEHLPPPPVFPYLLYSIMCPVKVAAPYLPVLTTIFLTRLIYTIARAYPVLLVRFKAQLPPWILHRLLIPHYSILWLVSAVGMNGPTEPSPGVQPSVAILMKAVTPPNFS